MPFTDSLSANVNEECGLSVMKHCSQKKMKKKKPACHVLTNWIRQKVSSATNRVWQWSQIRHTLGFVNISYFVVDQPEICKGADRFQREIAGNKHFPLHPISLRRRTRLVADDVYFAVWQQTTYGVFLINFRPQTTLCSTKTAFFTRISRRTVSEQYLSSLYERKIRSRSRSG